MRLRLWSDRIILASWFIYWLEAISCLPDRVFSLLLVCVSRTGRLQSCIMIIVFLIWVDTFALVGFLSQVLVQGEKYLDKKHLFNNGSGLSCI